MPAIQIVTQIRAPIEVCFDLARSIDLHVESMIHTGERVVGGVTCGLIGLGEEVTWEARHFGIRQRLTSRITAYDRPHYFRDSQVSGAFRRFDHDHRFLFTDGVTTMTDVFDYESPLGPLGRIADLLFLARYMRALIERRCNAVRDAAQQH